eukprot:SAG31_NODE_3863_length_3810_cov_9.181083_3_plen_100_part_00
MVARDVLGWAGLGERLHVVYALSKDFGLSGLRIGVLHTENEDALLPLTKLNDLCQVQSRALHLVAYHETNPAHSMLVLLFVRGAGILTHASIGHRALAG